jgi:hypothetical protein
VPAWCRRAAISKRLQQTAAKEESDDKEHKSSGAVWPAFGQSLKKYRLNATNQDSSG